MKRSSVNIYPSHNREGSVNCHWASARAELWILVVIAVAGVAVAAWSRVGLLDLPSAPSGITADASGLARLEYLHTVDEAMRQAIASQWQRLSSGGAARAVPNEQHPAPNVAEHLEEIQKRVQKAPDNLAIANGYRMEVFRLRRDFLNEARKRGEITPQFPEYLDKQPIKFFEELVREHPSRETKLSLALAWVDNMLLFPALEIKAPSSVQSVDILTEILSEPGNEYYVPALFARGLNHLHRPARLVWPESAKTPIDAAAHDIAKCVAIGRKLGVGSKRLQATLAMTLGDAYLKAGRFSLARSWWQIAQNTLPHGASADGPDQRLMQAIMRRYAWRDEEMLDRLEEELDRSRSELEHPMTDLALMWN